MPARKIGQAFGTRSFYLDSIKKMARCTQKVADPWLNTSNTGIRKVASESLQCNKYDDQRRSVASFIQALDPLTQR